MPPTLLTTAINALRYPSAANNGADFATGIENLADDVDADLAAIHGDLAAIHGTWRTIAQHRVAIPGGTLAGDTYVSTLAGGVVNSGGNMGNGIPAIPITAADMSVTGLNSKLRLLYAFFVNGVTLGTSVVKVGLYPLSSIGGVGSSDLVVTLGTVIAGSQIQISSSGNDFKHQESSEFAPPADGVHTIGFNVATANVPANILIHGQVFVQARNVAP